MSRRAFPPFAMAAAAALAGCRERTPASAVPLPQEVYVWQRVWTTGVVHAVRQAAPRVAGFTVLAAEVAWTPAAARVATVPVDYAALRATGKPIGLALRIGPYRGDFGAQAPFLARLAAGVVAEARAAGVTPSELQVDFDAAESQLEGYRAWLAPMRIAVRPTPLAFTALPAWLDRSAFRAIAGETDGFVLQVHSVTPPRSGEARFSLCEPAAARRWVERAARLGRPFRVALPSYAYLAAFGGDGRCLGLSAEGPALDWGPGVTVRRVEADAVRMAGLVREWSVRRPAALRGPIWYRLPVADDNLNWRWPTLSAILAGGVPRPSVRAVVESPAPGLTELVLVNDGTLDAPSDLAVTVRWSGGAPLASEAVAGFGIEGLQAAGCGLRRAEGGDARVPRAGERQVVAWFRFETAGVGVKAAVVSPRAMR